MKKVMLMLAALLLTASCGANESPGLIITPEVSPMIYPTAAAGETATAAGETATEAPNADGYVFVYNGESVHMNEDMAAVLEKLGEPKTKLEAPSCAFPNEIDRIYGYAGANILTYPDGGADFVHTVNFMDDSITTPEGIRLGDSLADIEAAYGDGYTVKLSQYTYGKGDTYLRFLLDGDNTVISITYGLTKYMEVL